MNAVKYIHKNPLAAVVQMKCIEGDLQANTAHLITMLEKMVNMHPQLSLIVFPEMILYGYAEFDRISTRYTQKDILNSLSNIAVCCQNYQCEVVIGAPYIKKNHIENALYFIDKGGFITYIYSKQHLINKERAYFTAGKELRLFPTVLGKTGFLICWDSAFPELARQYYQAGAEALIICAAWEKPYGNQWQTVCRARSLDNSLPVLASNQTGHQLTYDFAGHSMICDRIGNPIHEMEAEEGYILSPVNKLLDRTCLLKFGSPVSDYP